MISLDDRAAVLCDGVSRREWLRVGGLSVLGLSLPALLRAGERPAAATPAAPRLAKDLQGSTFGRAKNVIFLWLQGGPPQHETFDPKPDAPAEIRGPFKPIATNVPGIRFCFALAGAGIAGGQVYGASDKNGAFPATDPIGPQDLTATIFHLLGIDPHGVFHDKTNRPHLLTKGEPLVRLLGTEPATSERRAPEGDPAFVPPYDTRLLLDTDFRSGRPLLPPSPPTRDKGWRAWPLWEQSTGNAFSVKLLAREHQVALGFGLGGVANTTAIPQGSRALLAQAIRSARGGHYTFTVRAAGEAVSADTFEKVFLANFTCRLVIFRFADTSHDPRQVQVLASADFKPAFGDGAAAKTYVVERFLGSTQPGANFPIGNGLGVAVVVEKTSPGTLQITDGSAQRAFLRIDAVTLEFNPRPRDDSVTV